MLRPSDATAGSELPFDLRKTMGAIESALKSNRLDEAENLCNRVLGRMPQFPPALFFLAIVSTRRGDPQLSIELLRQVVSAEPKAVQAVEALGKLLVIDGQTEEGLVHLKRACELAPSADLFLHLAVALSNAERYAEAEPWFEQAVNLEPQFHVAYEPWAANLQVLGRFDRAKAVLRRAIELQPTFPGPYLSLVHLGRVTADDEHLAARLAAMLDDESRSKDELRQLNYALGKVLSDLGRYKDAMKRFDSANALAFEVLLKSKPFDLSNLSRWVDRQISAVTPACLSENRSMGIQTDTPIFIVGMIRSGTTLTEQILSSHSEIASAGEVVFWSDAKRMALADHLAAGLPDATELRSTAKAYSEMLERPRHGRKHVIDKMPFNYLTLGLINMALPNARIIHCRRAPVDTCLSIYMTPFQEGAAFCYRRPSIVAAYKEYLRIIAHWRSVLPADRFLEVDYESIVADRELAAREMVEFCGLDWDDACLHPDRNTRTVDTPSRWQVRQPIYDTSIDKWLHFQPWLREFESLLPPPDSPRPSKVSP